MKNSGDFLAERPFRKKFSPEFDVVMLDAIHERCRRISEITAEISKKEFLNNFVFQDAVIQALEVIGEASGKLTPELRDSHAEVAFRQMKELRNVLIHQFDSVDVNLVWVIAKRNVPEFCRSVAGIRGEKGLEKRG